MKKYKFEILGATILIVGGYLIYKRLKEAKDLANNQNVSPETASQKESDIDTIINGGKFKGLRSTLMTFEPAYLKDWARATLSNQAVFTSKNVKYNTQGGLKVTTKKVTTSTLKDVPPTHYDV
jgi:hypothetical protein